MNNMLLTFIDMLQKADFEMTAEEIADILLLARIMSQASGEASPPQEQDTRAPQSSHEGSSSPLHARSSTFIQQPADKATTSVDVHVPFQEPSQRSWDHQEEGRKGTFTRMPTAPALMHTLALGRALRPLRIRYPSSKTAVLNERATLQQVAETGKRMWAPILEPASERWFDLALVIDEGASMVLWHQIVIELKTFFERLGAFRDVRVWGLATDNRERADFYAGSSSATIERMTRKPEELIDPTRRRLIIVATDCVSPAWYSGKVQDMLEIWGQKNHVTLLQMLPQQLWTRSALRASEMVSISASAPATANARLKASGSWFPTDELCAPIPVVTLDQQSLTPWARMIIGSANTKVAGIMFEKDLDSVFSASSSPQKDPLTAHERVQTFRASSSSTARTLANLLAVYKENIIPPIVRIIQQTMLKESNMSHMAEVFLGGLLKETPRDHIMTHPEYREYEFFPGVREELLAALPLLDEDQVLRTVSAFCEEHLGITRDFLGVVATPFPSAEFPITQESRPFAKILAETLRRRGDSQFADQIEKRVDTPATIATVERLLKEARTQRDKERRAIDLLDLLPRLSSMPQVEVMREAVEIMHGRASSKHYVTALLNCLGYIPEEYKIEIIPEIVGSVRMIAGEEVQVEILDNLLQNPHLPDSWKGDVLQQILVATRAMADEALPARSLQRVLDHVPAPLRPVVEREIQSTAPNIAFLDPQAIPIPNPVLKRFRDKPPPSTQCICPSCFEKIYMSDCDIVSGVTPGKVLKVAPKGRLQLQIARGRNPETLDTPYYHQEKAQRQCPICKYLLPPNIERVASVTLAVVGDDYTGKSHYIAALIHQLELEWAEKAQNMVQFICLTPKVEEKYRQELLEPLFEQKHILASNRPAMGSTAEPLIYNLTVAVPHDEPMTVNLLIYDASGEDFENEQRMVRVARFVLNASAFIYVADPVRMTSIYEQLPPSLQFLLQDQFKLAQERKAAESLNEIISVFERYHRYSVESGLPDTPIAVMLSKADLLKYLSPPKSYSFMVNPHYRGSINLHDIDTIDREVRNFLMEHDQGDLEAAISICKRVKFFATSATGEPPDARGNYTHVEPRRCLDPLLWVLYQLGIIAASV